MYGYIYETTNLINGKKYVGQKKSEIFLGEKYLGSGKHLKQAVAYYGRDKFKVRLVEKCYSQEDLDSKEIYYIKLLRESYSSEMIYNIADGGSGGMGSSNKGRCRSKETREKISRGHIGIKMSESSKKKLSESKKKLVGELHPFYGKHHSKEARIKMSVAHLGKKLTEEHKRNISLAEKGRVFSEEWRDNLSKSLKGKPLTDSHRKALSKSAIGKVGINDGNNIKRVNKSELDYYIERGWKLGYPKSR